VLAIAAPEGYAVAEADPTPDEVDGGVAEWNGREDFDDGRPSVRASPDGAGGGSADGGDGGPDDGIAGDDDTLAFAGIAALLFTIGLAAAAYAVRSGRLVFGKAGNNEAGTGSESESGANGGTTAASGSEPDASGQGETGPSAVVDESGDKAIENDDETAATAGDPGLLTDGDRVRRALGNEGGRMKQSAIVEELGWSKSKTSRVLSRMADEGAVEKLRIGRENVIDLVEEGDD